jgi:hypothetical protein
MAEHAKRGRKPKGNREAVSALVPVEHKKLYEDLADRMGIPLTDYVALYMARAHNLPDPDYIQLRSSDAPVQEELRMSA